MWFCHGSQRGASATTTPDVTIQLGAVLFLQLGTLWAKDRRIRVPSLGAVVMKECAMFQSQNEGRKSTFETVPASIAAYLASSPVNGLVAFGRKILKRVQNRSAVACDYCGSSIAPDVPNCLSCGAGAPPPPLPSAKAKTSTGQRVATGALWYFGGILGLHCYAAGRPYRGLIYLATFIIMFFMAMSYIPGQSFGGLGGFGPLTIAFGLFLLWCFDGVQILLGRFNKQSN